MPFLLVNFLSLLSMFSLKIVLSPRVLSFLTLSQALLPAMWLLIAHRSDLPPCHQC